MGAHKAVDVVAEQPREVPDGLMSVCEAVSGVENKLGLG